MFTFIFRQIRVGFNPLCLTCLTGVYLCEWHANQKKADWRGFKRIEEDRCWGLLTPYRIRNDKI